MEKNEWLEYVQKVATWDYPIPLHLISNYEDWKCRSVVGRMLFIMRDIEGAMAVLATVRDVQPDMNDAPEFGMSEAEHKVLCLRDLAEIIWMLTGTSDAALYYLKEADKLCRSYKSIFRSADRGAVWVRRLEILRSCGQEEKALAEAGAEIAAQQDKEKINPYRFHALLFLAQSLAAKEEYSKAALLIEDAYQSFPLTAAAENDLAQAAAAADPRERYEKFLHCTTIQYQPWERGSVPTLEDVRRLQEENFKKREAARQNKNDSAGMDALINRLK